jgi:hypothetical protein
MAPGGSSEESTVEVVYGYARTDPDDPDSVAPRATTVSEQGVAVSKKLLLVLYLQLFAIYSESVSEVLIKPTQKPPKGNGIWIHADRRSVHIDTMLNNNLMVDNIPSIPAEVVKAVANASNPEQARIARDLVLGTVGIWAGVYLLSEYKKSKAHPEFRIEEEQSPTVR